MCQKQEKYQKVFKAKQEKLEKAKKKGKSDDELKEMIEDFDKELRPKQEELAALESNFQQHFMSRVTEKSKDNPVFYVQYAYARINSIFRLLKLDLRSKIKIYNKDFTLNRYEIEILKKISEWPKCVEISSTRLEPHRIPFYLYELVTLFHSYWNLGNDNKEFRFVTNNNINNYRLVVLQALSIVIKNGMLILGVSTPSSM